MLTASTAPELVLAIFVHGFKGGSDTYVLHPSLSILKVPRHSAKMMRSNSINRFSDFPERLRAILAPCGIEFEPVVYPAFDTRGELRVAGKNKQHFNFSLSTRQEGDS